MRKNPLAVALHLLKFRPRSVFEVEQKLKSKKISDQEIKKVISVLKENQLLDDTRFAKMWVGDRNLLKPTGLYLLKLELKKLGIADVDIQMALKDQNEEELARRAVASKARYRNARLGSPEARRADFNKRAAFLARRGFSTGVIYKVLKNEEGHD